MADETAGGVNVLITGSVAGLGAAMAEASADVKEATTSMQESLDSLAATADAVMAPFLAITAILSGGALFGDAVSRTADLGKQLEITSQKTGIAADELSRLQYAATLSDVSTEELMIGLQRLARNAEQAARSGVTPAALALKALGINATDTQGRLVPMEQLLTEVAQRFSTMEDGTGKTALAMDLFGRSGAALIPLLNQGATGIAALEAEADRLGITMSTRDVEAANAYVDAMKRFHAEADAVERRIALALMPTLVDLASTLTSAASQTGGWAVLGTIAGDALKVIATTATVAWTQLRIYYDTVTSILHGHNPWPKIKQDAQDAVDTIRKVWKSLDPLAEDPALAALMKGGLTPAPAVTPKTTGPSEIEKWKGEWDLLKQKALGTNADLLFLEAEFWQKKLDMVDKGSKEYLEILGRITALDTEIQKRSDEESKKNLKAMQTEWLKVFDDIPKAWTNAVNNMKNTGQSFGAFMGEIFRSLAIDALSAEAKIIIANNAAWLTRKENALEGWALEKAGSAAAAIVWITNEAAKAAASAWAAMSAVPFIGPILAPAAAAATLAAVIALAGSIRSAAGGFDVPSGLNPITQLHAREMVLPKEQADVIRNLSNGGGGQPVIVNIQALDGPSVAQWANRNKGVLGAAAISAAHEGLTTPTSAGRRT